MRKWVILIGILLIFTGTGQAKTLFPLPYEVEILPDFPQGSISEFMYPRTGSWDTAFTTELARWKFLYSNVGWTVSQAKWVLGAGLDIKRMAYEINATGNPEFNFEMATAIDQIPINVCFYLTYGFDADLNARAWMAGIGVDLLNFRCK